MSAAKETEQMEVSLILGSRVPGTHRPHGLLPKPGHRLARYWEKEDWSTSILPNAGPTWPTAAATLGANFTPHTANLVPLMMVRLLMVQC